VTEERTWSTYFEPLKARLGARKETFEKIFSHLDSCDEPIIVETGTYREENNYTGDGCSTLLFDNYIDIRGTGQLISIDIDPAACELARSSTKHAEVIESDSVEALDVICEVLGVVRRTKTEAKVSQRAEVAKLVVTADEKTVKMLQANLSDLRNAGSLQEIEFVVSDSNSEPAKVSAQVTLAAPLN